MLERGVRPIGLWSIRIARERYSLPVKDAQLNISLVRYFLSNRPCRFLWSISYMKEDLPEPETPVMQTILPNGTFALRFLILKIFPPTTFSSPFSDVRLLSGISILASSRR